MILLRDNYDSFTFNLWQAMTALGVEVEVARNDALTVEAALALRPSAIVLSPGPGRPADAGIQPELFHRAPDDLPILGVCLGHQAIGQVYGCVVKRAPVLMHGKLSKITNTGKGLFKGLPKSFEVTRYHSLIVERKKLPDNLMVTAKTGDGLIMGLQHKTHPVHGVQFHPESIASEHGHALLANFLELVGISPRRPNVRPARHAA